MVYDMLLMYHTITAFPYLVRSAHPPPLELVCNSYIEKIDDGTFSTWRGHTLHSHSLSLFLFLLFIFHSLFLSLSSLLLFFSYSIFLSITVSRYFSLSCSSIDLSFYYSSTAISVYSSVSCSSRILSFFLFLSLCLYFFHSFICCRSLLFPFFASYLVKELPSTRSVLYLSRLSCLLLNTREQSPLGEGSLYGWSLI